MDISGSRGFTVSDVERADSVWTRFRGMMLRRPVPLLLETRAVHGFWLRSPLWLVGIAGDMTVTDVALLRRRRMLRMRSARWVLELPPDSRLPRVGERLAFHRRGDEASGDARPTVPVRHSDRQPG